MTQPKIWDVVVVGGGPAGMMAAGRAAELGRSVLLLEKIQLWAKRICRLKSKIDYNFTSEFCPLKT